MVGTAVKVRVICPSRLDMWRELEDREFTEYSIHYMSVRTVEEHLYIREKGRGGLDQARRECWRIYCCGHSLGGGGIQGGNEASEL